MCQGLKVVTHQLVFAADCSGGLVYIRVPTACEGVIVRAAFNQPRRDEINLVRAYDLEVWAQFYGQV